MSYSGITIKSTTDPNYNRKKARYDLYAITQSSSYPSTASDTPYTTAVYDKITGEDAYNGGVYNTALRYQSTLRKS